MIFTNLIYTNLRTNILGKNIEYYQRLESTNAEAWELLEEDLADHGMIVITDNQTGGKGRNGNKWFMSPSKGLAMSLILNKQHSLENAELIPIATGVAVAMTLKNRGLEPRLKWPNDIMIGDKKCGGILCESKVSGQKINQMVIGLGININETKEDFPEYLNITSTSLFLESGRTQQRELICAIFTTFLEKILDDLDSAIDEWKKYCAHIDEEVSFTHDGVKQHGIFKDINERGHALIEVNSNIKTFPSIILD